MNKHDKAVIDELQKRGGATVLIYGDMAYGVESMNLLREYGIDVKAFIVDEGYGKSVDNIDGIPVKFVDEFSSCIEKYSVVIGFQNMEKCRAMLNMRHWLKTNIYMFWEPVALVEWNHEWYVKHMPAFEIARNCLADTISQKTLDALIEARENGCIDALMKLAVPNQYFNCLTYERESSKEVFLDCGAFNGDTILAYNQFTSGQFEKIIAFEPEEFNAENIKKNTEGIHDVYIIPKGLWDQKTILHFTSDSSASRVEENGASSVEVTSIDSVMNGERVSFIKMDIEGSEYEALLGAERTIKKWMPKLAICVYHKCDDIFKFIAFLDKFKNEECKYVFYLRHHTCTAYETVLYAIPQVDNCKK